MSSLAEGLSFGFGELKAIDVPLQPRFDFQIKDSSLEPVEPHQLPFGIGDVFGQ